MGVEFAFHGRRRLFDFQDAIDESRDAQGQNAVHVVPEFPFGQHAVGPFAAATESVAEVTQKRVEVVVMDDERAAPRVVLIVLTKVSRNLETNRGLSRAFFAEDDRRRRIARIAEHLVPARMVRARDAMILENKVRLRIFLREWVAGDAVMFEELRKSHGSILVKIGGM